VSLIDALIGEADDLRRVRRRSGAYDASGRYQRDADLVALVRLRVQPRGTDLARDEAGDNSAGGVNIWAPLTDLAAAEDVTAPGVPLGWSELNIAPSEHVQGPPGDVVEWKGRDYEVTSEDIHDGDGPLIGGFRRYVGTELGATA
jgi:hypothetical protein